jgi:prepilin-type N-terminal cleavage/methylation domain-containing protein
MKSRGTGFTLVELLVVMVIIALLMAIAVKSYVAQIPQREVVGAVDTFSNDLRWVRTQAAKSGNFVYLAFKYDYDPNQIEPPFGGNVGDRIWGTGVAVPPDNPGISRACRGYVIVEARPRYHQGPPPDSIRNNASMSSQFLFSEWGAPGVDPKPSGSVYTYKDYLDDLWMAEEGYPGQYRRPLEPIYPKDEAATNKLLSDNVIARDDANINRDSVPEIFYPFMLYGDPSSSTTYQSNSGYMADEYQTALQNSDLIFFRADYLQSCKLFDSCSRSEIISYNANYQNEFTTTQSGFVYAQQKYDLGDHPRLFNSAIIDHVTIYKREFSDSVYLMNPYKSKFLVEWDSTSNYENWQDFQYLQFVLCVDPDGRLAWYDWSYAPDTDDYFLAASMLHGSLELRDDTPRLRSLFVVAEDAVDFVGESAFIADSVKAGLEGNGRMVTLWPLVGKYYVDTYAPNDREFYIADYDSRLDISNAASGFGRYISSYGYRRNFLTP